MNGCANYGSKGNYYKGFRNDSCYPGKVVLRIFKFEESEFKTLKQHTRHFDVYM